MSVALRNSESIIVHYRRVNRHQQDAAPVELNWSLHSFMSYATASRRRKPRLGKEKHHPCCPATAHTVQMGSIVQCTLATRLAHPHARHPVQRRPPRASNPVTPHRSSSVAHHHQWARLRLCKCLRPQLLHKSGERDNTRAFSLTGRQNPHPYREGCFRLQMWVSWIAQLIRQNHFCESGSRRDVVSTQGKQDNAP